MEKDKKITRKNTVRIVGHLKENLLEKIVNSDGVEVIRGSMIISIGELESHKVQFYVVNKEGSNFADFESLLPENTTTIAGYLKSNPTATFATACSMATKVWAMARFDEYATRVGEREDSMILLKGFKAGFKVPSEKSPFVPCAEFTCDVYINDLREELDEDSKPTGRAILEGILPAYNDNAYKIDFVAPAEDNIAKYILSNYHVSDTVTINGDVVSLSIQEQKEDASKEPQFFGRQSSEPQYITKFVRERRIRGGSATPISNGSEGSITTEEVKIGLATREIKMVANGSKKNSNNKTSSPAPQPVKKDLGNFDF